MDTDPKRSAAKLDGLMAYPRLIIILLVVVSLSPFLNKAVNIDDPLFVWTAKWIHQHPGDFFGATVNWFGVALPMYASNFNPPGTSYLLALVGALCGWSEFALHGAMLLVAIVAALGVHALAREWCGRPLLAAVIALFSPVFLVSSTTLMSDIPMFALWVWALVMWERGLNPQRLGRLLFAGVLMGLAILTKYSALTFLPIPFLLGALRIRRGGLWLWALAVPLVMLGGYEFLTGQIYPSGLFSLAREYASANTALFPGGWLSKHVIGSVFVGGCVLPIFFLGPMLWVHRRAGLVAIIGFGVVFAILSSFERIGPMLFSVGESHDLVLLQIALLAAAGIHVLALVAAELWQRRDLVTGVLSAWILGGLLFSMVFNWTVSARSLLPIVPAIAILVVRRLDRIRPLARGKWTSAVPLIPAAMAAIAIAGADSSFANSARTAAQKIAARYTASDRQLWFQGHWGFQYYMQELGARAVDFERSTLQLGDVLVVPANGSNTIFPPAEAVETTEILEFPVSRWISTMHLGHSGFYAADWGPLPFAFDLNPPEKYYVLKLARAIRFRAPQSESDSDSIISKEALKIRGNVDDGQVLALQTLVAQAMEFQKDNRVGEAIGRYRAALQIFPDSPLLMNNLAWLLASSSDATLRNGEESVQLASRAAELTQNKEPMIIGTLAAAYAEAGRFEEAVAAAQRAIEQAKKSNQTDIATRNGELMDIYRQKKAYHEVAR